MLHLNILDTATALRQQGSPLVWVNLGLIGSRHDMSSCNLIVPIILPTKSLHLVEILENETVQDAIDTLLRIEGVTTEVLGDLEDCGWALQRLRAEECGRAWEEDELRTLGDGK